MYALTNNEDYNLINIEERKRIFEVGFFKHIRINLQRVV